MKKKILVVAMGNSIHTIRWVSVLSKLEFDVHLFNSFTIPNANYCERYPSNLYLLIPLHLNTTFQKFEYEEYEQSQNHSH